MGWVFCKCAARVADARWTHIDSPMEFSNQNVGLYLNGFPWPCDLVILALVVLLSAVPRYGVSLAVSRRELISLFCFFKYIEIILI